MPLNLITDPWIPVIRNGVAVDICPHQIADEGVERLNWPRPDLNLACYELLIGLVFLSDPPEDGWDWEVKAQPDPERLKKAFAPLTDAFNLTGDGPKFMQDLEDIKGSENPPDMLFLDSAGGVSLVKNNDLMVKRNRYSPLPLPLAAMALYTLQNFAPSGGAGNRTSLRGGGPMVTLVFPSGEGKKTPLWDQIWANVPYGKAVEKSHIESVLPWMRKTATSEKGAQQFPPEGDDVPHQVFFGMPRRLRLMLDEQEDRVIGIIQKNYGNNYVGWLHPLSPYYISPKSEMLPKHPRAGVFGYQNWLGIILEEKSTEKNKRAKCISDYQKSRVKRETKVLVGGWAMDNMKPMDFTWSEHPLFPFNDEQEKIAEGLVQASGEAGSALAITIKEAMGYSETQGSVVSSARETFFIQTQGEFISLLSHVASGQSRETVCCQWLKVLERTALKIFNDLAIPYLLERDCSPPGETSSFKPSAQTVVDARRKLVLAFKGYKPFGPKIFSPLELSPPEKKENKDGAKKKEAL